MKLLKTQNKSTKRPFFSAKRTGQDKTESIPWRFVDNKAPLAENILSCISNHFIFVFSKMTDIRNKDKCI